MATRPVYVTEPRCATATAVVTNAANDGSGSFTTPVWDGGTPTTAFVLKRIEVFQVGTGAAQGDAADSMVNVFKWVGGAATLIAAIDLGNPTATSVTTGGTSDSGSVGSIVLLEHGYGAGTDLRFAVTVAPTAGSIVVNSYCDVA